MEQHQLRRRRRTAVTILVTLAALGLTAVPSVSAVEDVESVRIAGKDRFETAAKIAAEAFPTGSDTVLVASGRAYPDALAGAALGLPLLLTERDELPAATTVALDDLDPDTVIILGGTAAVSEDVEDGIEGLGYAVDRIAGADRYETAADIAQSIGADNVNALDDLPTAIIATGRGFADALAGGPIATGDSSDDAFPILLVSDEVPDSTSAALDALGIEQVIILGGSAAVSSSVEADLKDQTGNDVIRLAGENRYSTAVDIAEFAIESLDFPAEEVLLASGLVFADALAGGPLGGVRPAPMLLTDPARLPEESEAFFVDHAGTIETITTLGGAAAVSESSADAAETAAETPPEDRVNETIEVSPTTAANAANGGTRTYTISGLEGAIDIALAPCAAVNIDGGGNTTFVNANGNAIADGTAKGGDAPDEADFPGYISSVNGSAQAKDESHGIRNDDYADNAAPDATGKVTFVVSGPDLISTRSSCVTPVVTLDENEDDGLTTTSGTATPTEVFGTGGDVTFSPGGAAAGFFDVDVDVALKANKDLDNFTGCFIESQFGDHSENSEVVNAAKCATYTYDANDTFQLNGIPSDLATFEANVTHDDDVRGTYSPDPALRSIFNLYEDEAPRPGTPDPAHNSDNANQPPPVRIQFLESTTSTTVSYRLYRATVAAGTTAAGCPTFSTTTYTKVGEVADSDAGTRAAQTPNTISESSGSEAQPAMTYCYLVIGVDVDDEGPATLVPGGAQQAIVVTTPGGGGTTTTTTTPGTAPRIVRATTDEPITQANPNPPLAMNDVHTLVFSKAMNETAAETSGSYGGTGANGTAYTITCGTNAACDLGTDRATLTVRLLTVPTALPTYPLTITTATNLRDTAGNNVDVPSSTDKTIDNT